MKKLFSKILTAILICVLLMPCAACREQISPERLYRVVIAESEFVLCSERVKKVRAGDAVTFSLSFPEGYSFAGTDASNARVEQNEGGVTLVLEHVTRSQYIEVSVNKSDPEPPEGLTVSVSGAPCDTPLLCCQIGEDVVFELNTGAEYLQSVDYAGEYEIFEGGGKSKLVLKAIKESTEVKVQTGEAPLPPTGLETRRAVRYEGCGGLIDGAYSAYTCVFEWARARMNAALPANRIQREGYTPTGWRVGSSGGEKIPFGGRFSSNGYMVLYAEWEAWTDETEFEYAVINWGSVWRMYAEKQEEKRTLEELKAEVPEEKRAAVLTKYKGEESKLVIPARLGGYSVRAIAREAVTWKSALEQVVLPVGLELVEGFAFQYNYELREVTLFDDPLRISPTAFGSATEVEIQTLNLNAVLPPVFGTSENGQFGNKMELLFARSSRPKLVFFGGCSVWYGLDCAYLHDVYGEKYDVVNMGVIGGTDARFQMDLIAQFLKSGDVFVHTPELISEYQLLTKTDFDGRVFTALECDYGLIPRLNLTRYNRVWQAFSEYITAKRNLMSAEDYEPKTYADRLSYMDEWGGLTKERGGDYDNEGQVYRFLPTADMNNSHAFQTMQEEYTLLSETGAKILFGYSPVNSDGINRTSGEALVVLLEQGFKEYGVPVTTFMTLDDCLLEKHYFYDTNYHLSNEGATVFTKRLVPLLAPYLR